MNPLVSIIIPCLNEEKSIRRCLDSIIANDYPQDSLEVIIVDGFSTDQTREIVSEYQKQHSFIRLVDNSKKTQQIALNLGIKTSHGKFIIRMDAHSGFSPNYISTCVHYLQTTEADNVGGRLATIPQVNSILGRSVAYAMSSIFGIGRSLFRIAYRPKGLQKPTWVSTVPYSCYRREVFEKIGFFTEQLARSEDAEFHQRMQKSGCKTLFIPTLVSYYYNRSDLKSFWKHAVDNGLWALLPTKYTRKLVVSFRHLIPLLFFLNLVSFIFFIFLAPPLSWIFAFPIIIYCILNFVFSLKIALKETNSRFFFTMPIVYFLLHIGYGLGSFWALEKIIFGLLKPSSTEPTLREPLDQEYQSSVSIIIPCRNEEAFIDKCLHSILHNDYPREKVEVLVIDGMSNDNTRKIVQSFVNQYSFIRMIDNPGKEQQLALNIGIKSAQGEMIMRMDAHSTYKSNYISECVRALNEYPAHNVGGRWVIVPREETLLSHAICFATSVFFGVGNAYYRLMSLKNKESFLNQPRWEINVAYFCCRKEVFDKIGLFNEKLDRSEDIDFRSRLKKAGYRTLFVPSIECYYSMRTHLSDFIKHMFRNGMWVLLPLNYAPGISFSIRHIIPLTFILMLIETAYLSHYYTSFRIIRFLIVGTYVITNLYYSFRIAIRERNIRYFFVLPWIFLLLHFSYGLGSLVGLLRLIVTKFFKIIPCIKIQKKISAAT